MRGPSAAVIDEGLVDPGQYGRPSQDQVISHQLILEIKLVILLLLG